MKPRTTFVRSIVYRKPVDSDAVSLEIITPHGTLYAFATDRVDAPGWLIEDADLVLIPSQVDLAEIHADFVGHVAAWLAPRIGVTPTDPNAVPMRDLIRHLFDDFRILRLDPAVVTPSDADATLQGADKEASV